MTAPVPLEAVAGAVAAARAHMRVAGSGEDAVLERLARTAFSVGEAFTGAAFIARAHEAVVPAAGVWTPLPVEPVTAITGVSAGGAALPVEAYAVDIDGGGCGWVRASAPAWPRVAVAYEAGLAATWDALPQAVAQGVVLLVQHLWEDRAGASAPPAAVAALWRPWRRMRLANPAKCYFAGTPDLKRRA